MITRLDFAARRCYAARVPDERTVEIEVEEGVARVRAPGFALPAALRAAYHRVGNFHVACELDGEAPVILLRPKRALDDEALAGAAEELARELPHAELRVALLDGNKLDRE